MVQATIKDIIDGNLDQVDLSGIYIVRDGEHVLYVGRAVDVVQRLHDHIEKWASSAIGDVIHANAPQSLSWQVELMGAEECRSISISFAPLYEDLLIPISIESAERYMIRHYHPSLNTSNNPNPNRLPSHIKRYPVKIQVGATDDLF